MLERGEKANLAFHVTLLKQNIIHKLDCFFPLKMHLLVILEGCCECEVCGKGFFLNIVISAIFA